MSSLNLSPTEENCFSYISILKTHLWTCEMGLLFCTLTWKMAYMMQVSGRWWECSETLKMFRPHLLMSSRSYTMQERIYNQLSYKLVKSARFPCNRWSVIYDCTFESKSSKSVFTPKRAVLQLLDRPGPCGTFLTPLIWVISCCCLLFLSRDFGVGDGISSSFCLSTGGKVSALWVFISALIHSTHNRYHDSTHSQSEFKAAKWSSILVKATYMNFSAKFNSLCYS